MKNLGLIIKQLHELAVFLHECDKNQWAKYLEELIILGENKSYDEFENRVHNLFRGMGSLIDLSLYIEGNRERTDALNNKLSSMTHALYELAYNQPDDNQVGV